MLVGKERSLTIVWIEPLQQFGNHFSCPKGSPGGKASCYSIQHRIYIKCQCFEYQQNTYCVPKPIHGILMREAVEHSPLTFPFYPLRHRLSYSNGTSPVTNCATGIASLVIAAPIQQNACQDAGYLFRHTVRVLLVFKALALYAFGRYSPSL